MATTDPSLEFPKLAKPPDPTGDGRAGVALPRTFAAVTSFASTAAKPRLSPRFKAIELTSRQYRMADGIPTVRFTTAEFDAGVALFRHSLIAKFTVGRPPISQIRETFKANWLIKGRATVSEIWDGRHVMIILDSDEDATVALTSPIRKVGHAMFRLFRYSPDYNPRKEATTTTKWVRLPGLHPGFFTRNYISGIVNVFGHFLDVDERTKACASLRFARVCVEVDVTKAIPKEVQLTLSDGRKFKQIIEVEGNMAYCSHCRVHGHILDQCRKKKPYMDYKKVGEEYHNARFDSVQVKMGNGHNPSISIPDAPVGKGSKSKEDNNQDNNQDGWTEIKKRHRGRGRESSDVAKKADKQSVLNAGVTHKPISFVAEGCVAKESLEKGVDSHMEEAGASPVIVPTVKSSVVDNRHEKGIDSHMEIVEEVHNMQANELAMVVYGAGLPEQVGKIVVEDNFLVKENGELPSNGIAETSDRNAENGELPSNEEMQSSEMKEADRIARQIYSYGPELFYEKLGGRCTPRDIFFHLRTQFEDDNSVFQALDEIVKDNRRDQQEESSILEESEDLGPSMMPSLPSSQKTHRGKKRVRALLGDHALKRKTPTLFGEKKKKTNHVSLKKKERKDYVGIGGMYEFVVYLGTQMAVKHHSNAESLFTSCSRKKVLHVTNNELSKPVSERYYYYDTLMKWTCDY